MSPNRFSRGVASINVFAAITRLIVDPRLTRRSLTVWKENVSVSDASDFRFKKDFSLIDQSWFEALEHLRMRCNYLWSWTSTKRVGSSGYENSLGAIDPSRIYRTRSEFDWCVTGGACSYNLLAKNSSDRWITLCPELSRSSRINSHFGNRNETIPRDCSSILNWETIVTMFENENASEKENEVPEGKYQTASRRLVTVNWGSWSKLRLAPEFHLSVRSSIPLLLSLFLSLFLAERRRCSSSSCCLP